MKHANAQWLNNFREAYADLGGHDSPLTFRAMHWRLHELAAIGLTGEQAARVIYSEWRIYPMPTIERLSLFEDAASSTRRELAMFHGVANA